MAELKKLRGFYGPAGAARAYREHAKLVSASVKRFGSWGIASELAGFEKQRIEWSKASIVEGIREVFADAPAYASIAQRNHSKLYVAACKHFGSWKGAVLAAGLEYVNNNRNPWSKEKVIERAEALLKDQPDLSERQLRDLDPKLRDAAQRYFGGWRKVVQAMEKLQNI